MKLIPTQLAKRIPALGTYDHYATPFDIPMVSKLVDHASGAIWLIAEYDEDSNVATCYFDSGYQQIWARMDLTALEAMTYMGILQMERDPIYRTLRFEDCVDREGRIIA